MSEPELNQPKSSLQPKQLTQPNPKAVEANIRARLKELTNVNRIISNGINLIADVEIKGAHAGPVAEFTNWLSGFNQSLTGQIKTLEGTLPKKEEVKPEFPDAINKAANNSVKAPEPEAPKPVEPAAKAPVVTPKV